MNILTKRINLVVGHYGSGKTNFAIHLALSNVGRYPKTVLLDLDIVNPYFRASDHIAALSRANVRVIAPNFANTNLDTPSLPPGVQGALEDEQALVIADVGGDDAGAIVLGRYEEALSKAGYECFYVVNERRPMIASPQEAVACWKEIEAVARISPTVLVNNTNLGEESTAEIILQSRDYAAEIARLAGIKRIYTTALPNLAAEVAETMPNVLPMDLYTKQYF